MRAKRSKRLERLQANKLLVYAMEVYDRDHCEDCDDTGYLIMHVDNELKAVHGRVPRKKEIPEIQRCDCCMRCKDDDEAQILFMKAVVSGVDQLPDELILFGPKRKWEK